MPGFDEFLLEWQLGQATPGWETMVFEQEWESSQALGNGLTMLFEVCANDRETTFARASGESPLRVYASREVVQGVIENGTENEDACGAAEGRCNEDDCEFISRVFSTPQTLGPSSPADVGITVQQRFTQYASAFFWEPGPELFTAVP